jgi:release factor glutamine methyltransferase
MKIDSWIVSATKVLAGSGIKTARLDSLILLEFVLGKDRSWLLAHGADNITPAKLSTLNRFITQRRTHYPLAYITHRVYFYNNQFFVNNHVLVPRPESETIIDLLKTLPPKDRTVLIDIGTGSGVLAITAKLLFPKTVVFATDIDTKCLQVAKKNGLSLKANVKFFKSDLLKSLPAKLLENSVLLANLPYVPDGFTINESASLEPRAAIFGGEEGLDLYTQLFDQIMALKGTPSHVITESLPEQHDGLQSIANFAGYKLLATDDFIQVFSRPQ